MVKYEEALKIAMGLKPDIDNCREMDNAFIFGRLNAPEMEGGGNSPVVVLKDGGRAVTMPWYNGRIGSGKEIRAFAL